jgi:hypothetical protein
MNGVELTRLFVRGAACEVHYAVRTNGNCPAQEFLLDECEKIRAGSKNKPDSTARHALEFLFVHLSQFGPMHMPPKRFQSKMDGFFAFRLEIKRMQVRMVCFRDDANWILTNGFVKPGAQKGRGEWPEAEVDRAKAIRAEYYIRKAQGQKK